MTNKMANTEEDEELYENLKRNPKLHRYDEITINFGKPVILANHHNNSSIGNSKNINHNEFLPGRYTDLT